MIVASSHLTKWLGEKKMKIKRKITVEIERVKIKIRPAVSPTWCEICCAKAEFIEARDAAGLMPVFAERGVGIAERDLHYYHPPDSRPLICLNSIMKDSSALVSRDR